VTTDYISGRNAVLEALKNKRLSAERLILADTASGQRIDEAQAEATNREISIRISNTTDLDDLVGSDNHQGIALEITEIHPYTLEDLLARGSATNHHRLFLLDQVQDPVNFGKIARAASFFGFQGLVKTRDRSAPLSSTVIESSAGAAARIPVAQVKNLRRTMEKLREERYWLVGLVPDGDRPVEEVPTDRNLAILLGNEGSGLRRLTREECDYLVTIPGSGSYDSLNVATAGAVAAYALRARDAAEQVKES